MRILRDDRLLMRQSLCGQTNVATTSLVQHNLKDRPPCRPAPPCSCCSQPGKKEPRRSADSEPLRPRSWTMNGMIILRERGESARSGGSARLGHAREGGADEVVAEVLPGEQQEHGGAGRHGGRSFKLCCTSDVVATLVWPQRLWRIKSRSSLRILNRATSSPIIRDQQLRHLVQHEGLRQTRRAGRSLLLRKLALPTRGRCRGRAGGAPRSAEGRLAIGAGHRCSLVGARLAEVDR
eukprot:COSAG04_NODE_7062_length_1199_cov_1.194545_2_plen_237_part_00